MQIQRITVIDDSPEFLDVVGDALRSDGLEVVLLGEDAALDAIVATAPDVLVVDLRLGTDHLPGWQLVRAARSHPSLADVPIIICSGALDQLRGYGGSAVGTRTFLLPKPFSLDDLEAVLDEASRARSTPASFTVDEPAAVTFGSDPFAWFRWAQRSMATERWPEILAAIGPDAWRSPDGHPWRLVRTHRGVEVRPDLVSPFLRYGNLPLVSAIGMADQVEVELTTDVARWVDRFPCRTFDLGGLGAAMLSQRKLPHDNLPQLFPVDAPAEDEPASGVSSFNIGHPTTTQLRH